MRSVILSALVVIAFLAGPDVSAADFDAERQQMLDAISADVRSTAEYIDKDRLNEDVMRALVRVPRHEFVPEDQRSHAYENRPLPIGFGQTISQPYIVALMTDLLNLPPAGGRVLEIGTGSGYQAAVLADLGTEVFTIEIVEELGSQATERLKRLGYDKAHVRLGDGYNGWEEHAPYDGILVTAAASHVPPALVEQLKAGARMVIPVGGRFQVQQLMLVEKAADGSVTTRQMLPVQFVPLTGGH